MFVPPPNGISTQSNLNAAPTRASTGLAARPHDGVGHATDVAAAVAHEIAQALPARVDHPVQRLGRHRADRRLELGPQIVGQVRLGDLDVLERDRALLPGARCRRRAPCG